MELRRKPGFHWLWILVALAGCAGPAPMPRSAEDRIIYVVERGWHTDIALPVETLIGPLAALARKYPGARFLTFGFGERNYLLKRHPTPGAMLAAMLPSPSALLVTLLGATPEEAFGYDDVVVLRVSGAGFARIQADIEREFELSAAGEPIVLGDGPYPGSVFYAATDIYDGLYTCNTWTADVLHAGGLSMPVAGVVFSGQVMGMVRWIRAQQLLSQQLLRLNG